MIASMASSVNMVQAMLLIQGLIRALNRMKKIQDSAWLDLSLEKIVKD